MKKWYSLIRKIALLLCVAYFTASAALAQSPQLPPPPGSGLPNLRPLALVNVALDGVAKPIGSSPTGTPFQTPEFAVPRSGAEKILEIRTRDGRASVQFSRSLPAGVPQSAVQFIQDGVPAPNAVGRLRYTGCVSCPASITIGVSASDPSGTVSGQVRLNLTASTGRPALTSLSRNGGSDVRPRYEIRYAAGTFDPSDSEVVGVYAGNLKYRLIPDNSSNFAGGVIFVVAPRLKAERNIQIFLRNAYGASDSPTVQLPLQQQENNPSFECINCSTVSPNSPGVNDTFSARHTNNGVLPINGSDQVTVIPAVQSGSAPCDQNDFFYLGAAASWINDDGAPQNNLGTVSITSQPPTNQLLRGSQNRITTSWSLNALSGSRFYQVKFRGINIVGVCSNRVIQ